MDQTGSSMPLATPPAIPPQEFDDAAKAVAHLIDLFDHATEFLKNAFQTTLGGLAPESRFRAYYPEIRLTTSSFAQIDSRLAFGHVAEPGTYATTITRPRLFANYLTQQISLLLENHNVPVQGAFGNADAGSFRAGRRCCHFRPPGGI